MPMNAKVTGIAETRARTVALREHVAKVATRKACRAGAEVILAADVAMAPVLDEKTAKSTALDPGALKADLGIRVARQRQKEGLVGYIIGPVKLSYAAHWVEYGHRLVKGGQIAWIGLVHGKLRTRSGSGRVIGDVSAHPFLRPAFEGSWQQALIEFAASMTKQVKEFLR